jgi:transposase
MYVGCGMSCVSEMEAFTRAVAMLRCIGVSVKSVRLDKYFSSRKVIELFGRSVSLFLIPKKNVRKIGVWSDILAKIKTAPFDFLTQYFKRNLCESGFSADKGRFGRNIMQKREDRQQTTLLTNALFHNIDTTRTNTK